MRPSLFLMSSVFRLAAPAVAALLLSVAAMSAEPAPSADDLVNKLTPPSRSFVPSNKGISVEPSAAQPAPDPAPPSVDLEVNFEFNSAKLTTDAMLTLDNLARALQDPKLVSYRFQVAGHTDGKGSDNFNKTLSEARAKAVREYLVSRHGIDNARLESVGYGRSQLLDKEHPEAAVNRRVQITNLGG